MWKNELPKNTINRNTLDYTMLRNVYRSEVPERLVEVMQKCGEILTFGNKSHLLGHRPIVSWHTLM